MFVFFGRVPFYPFVVTKTTRADDFCIRLGRIDIAIETKNKKNRQKESHYVS